MSPELTVAASQPLIRHRFTAFGGSICEVLSVDADEADVSDLVAEVYSFEAQLTRFDPRSELSHFNAAAGMPTPVSPLLEALLRTCLEAHALSDGLVNAAIHHALVAAGYDKSIQEVRRHSAAQVARGCPGNCEVASPGGRGGGSVPVPPLPDLLDVGKGWARLAPGHGIDLGGVGKGWLADRLCERFDDACVNLGGDLRARGGGPDGLGWLVGLGDGSALRVNDGGVATSGTTGRRWSGGHHLIDPRTGAPADCAPIVISVAAANALTAEVLAKGAVLVGPSGAAAWLRERGAATHSTTWPDGEPVPA